MCAVSTETADSTVLYSHPLLCVFMSSEVAERQERSKKMKTEQRALCRGVIFPTDPEM